MASQILIRNFSKDVGRSKVGLLNGYHIYNVRLSVSFESNYRSTGYIRFGTSTRIVYS